MILTFTSSSSILNWASASSWSPSVIPTLGDLCIFDSNSATCSLNIIGTCSAIDFTTYNKQFRFNNNGLGVYGTISFGPNMGYSFSTTTYLSGYNLAQIVDNNTNLNIITNGATVGVPFLIYGNATQSTHTITGNLVCLENLSISSGGIGLTQTINGSTISAYKDLRFNLVGSNNTLNTTDGTANYIMLGNGNLSYGGGSLGGILNGITINGTVSLVSNINVRRNVNILTNRVRGAFLFNFTGNGTFSQSSFTSSTSIAAFGIGTSNAAIVNLTNDFYTVRQISTIGGQFNNYNLFTCGGINNITQVLGGNATITIIGTASTSVATCVASTGLLNPFVINTPGIVNLGNMIFESPTTGFSFVYTSGNVNATGTITLNGNVSNPTCLFSGSGINFNNINISGSNYRLNLTGNIVCRTLNIGNQTYGFTGSGSWTCDRFTSTNANTFWLKEGLTYTINRMFDVVSGNLNSNVRLFTGASGSVAYLNLVPGSTQSLYSFNVSDIDSSGGNTIWCYNLTSNNTKNWNTLLWNSPQTTLFTTS